MGVFSDKKKLVCMEERIDKICISLECALVDIDLLKAENEFLSKTVNENEFKIGKLDSWNLTLSDAFARFKVNPTPKTCSDKSYREDDLKK